MIFLKTFTGDSCQAREPGERQQRLPGSNHWYRQSRTLGFTPLPTRLPLHGDSLSPDSILGAVLLLSIDSSGRTGSFPPLSRMMLLADRSPRMGSEKNMARKRVRSRKPERQA